MFLLYHALILVYIIKIDKKDTTLASRNTYCFSCDVSDNNWTNYIGLMRISGSWPMTPLQFHTTSYKNKPDEFSKITYLLRIKKVHTIIIIYYIIQFAVVPSLVQKAIWKYIWMIRLNIIIINKKRKLNREKTGHKYIYDLNKETGNALARVHKPVDIWDITFCTRRFCGFN